MSDDKNKRGSPDRDRIDINDPDEVRNWTQSLGVTKEELQKAVEAAGTTATKVREYLKSRCGARLLHVPEDRLLQPAAAVLGDFFARLELERRRLRRFRRRYTRRPRRHDRRGPHGPVGHDAYNFAAAFRIVE